jgi:PAS domain S-box-containing protein
MQAPSARPSLVVTTRHASLATALLALLAGLAVTAMVVWQTVESDRSEAQLQFRGAAERLAEEIVRRVGHPEVGLRGMRAMIAANGGVDRLRFRKYIAALDMQRAFPGIRGFGFVERVPRADLAAFIERERQDHAPDFTVRTAGDAPDLLVIKYIEPRNPVLGLDIGSDPVRRDAVELAVITGAPTLSEPIVLSGGGIYGWLMLVPVFREDAAALPLRERMLGLLYAPIGVRELLDPLKGFGGGQVEFQLIDEVRGARTVIYDSRLAAGPDGKAQSEHADSRPLFDRTKAVSVGSRTFSVRTTSTPRMEAEIKPGAAIAIGVAGSALSLLLSLSILRQMQRREQAETQTQVVSARLERVAGGLADRDRLIGLIKESLPARLSYWDRDMRCQLANMAFASQFGKKPEQMLGVHVEDLLPPDWREDGLRRARAALQGTAQRFESSTLASGRVAVVYYVPDAVGQEIHGFFVFAMDVTELKQAQQAAQSASAAKTEFLSNISHEIRTPMNAVIGMLALLRMTRLDVRQADYAGKAEAAARSLLSLLNDVLDFSKIEAGKMTLDPRPFSFRVLLDDLAVILGANLGEKPVALRFQVDPAVPAWLQGDDMRLRQILINLGGNGLKFTRQGEVAVAVRLLRQDAGQAEVEVAVSDTGIGISQADQQRIFADFSQAAASTTREFGGTGLGLAICKRLARLMGTELELESVPGQGSRFHFKLLLPLAEGPADAGRQVQSSEAGRLPPGRPLQGCKLLIAEDNAINQQVARELLEAAGAEVHVVVNGREAVLAVAGGGFFDAVLMDVQMPVQDGYQATRDIRNRLLCTELPIIAMTANALDTDREQSLAAGMNDHIGKPFDPAALVAAILRNLRQPPSGLAPAPDTAGVAAAVPGAHKERPLVDRSGAVAALGGDEGLYRRLIPIFRKELQTTLEQLAWLAAGMPREEATRLLHTLKSSAANLGALRLSALAQEAESASREPGGLQTGALLDSLRQAIIQTQAVFDRMH